MTHARPTSLDQVRDRLATTSADEVFAESLERAGEIAELGAFLCLAEGSPAAGAQGAPLAGVPLAVKDNLDTADFPTSGGTRTLAGSRPGRDHLAVERLRAAGARVVGKTNLHELALGITSNNAAFGPVRNPHDPRRSPGGSSGGSAVAVATGVVPIALGTDTGGSMRVPAAHCGVVGWRPTVGRWGTDRTVPISRTRDTAGVFASTVADVAVVDAVVAGDSPGSAPPRLRLGAPRRGFFDDLDPEVAACTERALGRLADAGADLVDVDLADAQELDADCGFPIVFFELAEDLTAYLATLHAEKADESVGVVLWGVACT
jgi:mandelamide amidase